MDTDEPLEDAMIAAGFRARPDLRRRFEAEVDACRALGFAGLLEARTQPLWDRAWRTLTMVRTAGAEALGRGPR
ncbi:MAG TPA: hypothetical protein VNO79_09095 [Actinomycetota bacterium]|nr:hypothetical protein [Actinomycetota bacterium]HXF72747.1 hypothetical protein [Actinomycetota bacterium]